MRKDEVDKEPSTVYLEKDLKYMAKSQDLNLSETINNLLRTFLSVGSKEEIYKEIDKHRTQLTILEKKLKKFEAEGVAETRGESMIDRAWDHAHHVFKIRCDGGVGEAGAREWVKVAKATEPLRRSGLQIDQIVNKLLEAYHGV